MSEQPTRKNKLALLYGHRVSVVNQSFQTPLELNKVKLADLINKKSKLIFYFNDLYFNSNM